MKEISGDKKFTSKIEALWYLAYNFVRGIAGHFCWLPAQYWHSEVLESGPKTPMRKYLNQFLLQELPKIIPISKIENILEVGCGSGYFRDILNQLGCKGKYVGVDIYKHDNFNATGAYPFPSTFVESKIEDFDTDKKFDLIISNTALEHVEDDAAAIQRCNDLIQPSGAQIHIIPSFWSLPLYLWHGYRQYNPKSVKRLFGHIPYKVYRLGGPFSVLLHLFLITIPLFILKTNQRTYFPAYQKSVEVCNKLDALFPIFSFAYVVIVGPAKHSTV